MFKQHFSSLKVWIIVIFFVLLLGSQAAGFYIYLVERKETLNAVGGDEIARMVASSVDFIESLPEQDRYIAVRRNPYHGVRMIITETPIFSDAKKDIVSDWISSNLVDILGGSYEVLVSLISSEKIMDVMPKRKRGKNFFMRPPQAIRVAVKLDNGKWLNVLTPLHFNERTPALKHVFAMFGVLGLVVILSLIVLSLSLKPLDDFAKAAERLGQDVNAKPLSEDGFFEVKKASKAFNLMQKRLKQLIDNRTRFLAAVSHDLRTPITRLRLRAEFVDDVEQQTKMLADLDEMEKMIAATLSFAKNEVAFEEKVYCDVAMEVNNICSKMKETGYVVEYKGKKEIFAAIKLEGFRRALTNLIDNAVKYGEKAFVDIYSDKDELFITVEDEGKGIPEEELEKVFMPFYRVDKSRSKETGGVGLGLSIVMSFADANGGKIILENIVKNSQITGLRVKMILPNKEA